MSKLPHVTLSLNPGQLSDLFFNYEHPARDKLYAEYTGPAELGKLLESSFTEEQERAAVLEDAKEFVATLGNYITVDDVDLPEALADDFMQRR